MGATREPGLRTRRAKAIAANSPPVQLLPDGTPESRMALVEGQEIAWVMKSPGGVTVGVSHVHRVYGGGKTYCGNAIPPEANRLPALPSLDPCSTCERLWKRAGAAEQAVAKRRGAVA